MICLFVFGGTVAQAVACISSRTVMCGAVVINKYSQLHFSCETYYVVV